MSLLLLLSGTVAWLLSPFWLPLAGPSGFNDQRLALVLLTAIAALVLAARWLVSNLVSRDFSYLEQLRPIHDKALIFLVLVIASAHFSEEPIRALQEAGVYCGLAALVICLAREFTQQEQRRQEYWFSGAVLAIATVYAVSLVANYVYVIANVAPGKPVWVVFPNFPNPRLFNHIQAVVIPGLFAATAFFRQQKVTSLTCLSTLVLLVWLTSLFYSQGRGVALSLVAGACLVALKSDPFRRELFGFAGAVAVAGICYYLLYVAPVPEGMNYVERLSQPTTSGRLEMWQISLELVLQFPLFGVGLQHFLLASQTQGSPHNLPLLLLVELGIPAALLALYLFAKQLKRLVAAAEYVTFIQATRIWALFSAVIYSFLTGNILSPISQLVLALLLAKVVAERGQRVSVAQLPAPTVIALVALAGISLLVTLADLIYFPEMIAMMIDGVWSPRFWLNGYFNFY